MGRVSVRCSETSLDISRELILLANVVPGGVYLVVNGLSKHTGTLVVCVWAVKVVNS